MRYLITFTVLTCVVATSFSRPSGLDEPIEGDQEEREYESDEEAAVDESMREDDGSQLDKQEQTYAEQAEVENEAIQKPISREDKRGTPSASDHHTPKDKPDDSPDYKMHDDQESEDMKPNQAQPLQQRPHRCDEAKEINEQTEMAQQMANANYNPSEHENSALHAVYDRRNVKTDDNADELFQNNVPKERNVMNNQQSNNDAPVEPEHEGFFKHYYKTLQSTNEKVKLQDKNYDDFPSNIYRNRRQVQGVGSLETETGSNVNEIKNTIHENEELAIKRHISKLTEQELEGLLNSLPDEKRALLNQIIERGKNHYDGGVSKRDITKKAGAVEENMDIENSVFDSNKVHGSSVDIKNDVEAPVDTTENTKSSEFHTESSEVPRKTSSQTLLNVMDSNASEGNCKSSVNLNEHSTIGETKSANVESNNLSSKLNSKRETNLNDFENKCPSYGDMKLINNDLNPSDLSENLNDDVGYSYQNEDLSQLMSNEALLENNAIDHVNKREASLENTDSFKSLEESFPNSNTYQESGQVSEMEMVPLVRVKRRNDGSLIKKRTNERAELVPDAKVAYIPYRAENDDDDSEEGNEFEDDGFYDRTSNFEKDNDSSQLSRDLPAKNSKQTKGEKIAHEAQSDTMNIGSDSDSVLSGVEGVDDNLMFNSGPRNRRTAEKLPIDLVDNDSRLSSLTGNELNTQTDNLNALNDQDNDAFGTLPKNYGNMVRLKRIRRVKQPCDDVSSSNTNK